MSRNTQKLALPPCGMYFGSGVYAMSYGYLTNTMYTHQTWTSQDLSPMEMIDKIIEDNQGNMVQLWGGARGYAPSTLAEWNYALDEIGVNVPKPDWEEGTYIFPEDAPELAEHADRYGAGLWRFIREAAKRGIYTQLIYARARDEWVDKFKEAGDYYLGYNYGERHTFRMDNAALEGKTSDEVTLKLLADSFMEDVREHVDERRKAGWGNIAATGANFFMDYEIAAGTDIPMMEDFAFEHLNVSSALSRGLYRQFDLPIWGVHSAHPHYSFIHNKSEHKWNLFKASLYMKYMSGAKIILIESGNWFVEESHCEDSPKFDLPHVPLPLEKIRDRQYDPAEVVPYREEAKKYFSGLDYNAPLPRRYRQEISLFYDFLKANGTPQGQPETTVAIAKGNYDLSSGRYNPNNAIASAFPLAEERREWYQGQPERGWNIVNDVFFPRPDIIKPYENSFISGTPFGQVDITSFVNDEIDSDFLLENYKALLFSGWNTSSEKQYETLKQYIHGGGTLFIAIPHLSTNDTRNFDNYSVDELVHQGDFSELCGVKVLSKGKRNYWVTAPVGNTELGFKYPRRFGILYTCMGNIEITDPNAEVLVVEDQLALPFLLRRKYGQGTVYFLNSWAYPGAYDQDFGPGSTLSSPGIVGMIYRYIAKNARGNVWITDDLDEPRSECEYINFSYFPEENKIYLLNIDYQQPRSFFLHAFGNTQRIELAAGEFKVMVPPAA